MSRKKLILLVMCGVSSLLFYAGVIVYSNYKNTKIISNEAKKEISQLKTEIVKLKEKLIFCEGTCIEPICHAGGKYQGDIRYIDCGASFTERWATCLCTTMCLEDFTIAVSNRERCKIWPSVPIQIRPEPKEEEE